MGLLKDFIERKRERNRKENEFEDADKISSNIERKKMSHNEREVAAILRKEAEKNFKDTLKWEEERRKADDLFHTRQMMMGNPLHLLE